MSAIAPKAAEKRKFQMSHFVPTAIVLGNSFDHLVCADEQIWPNLEAKSFRGPKI